MQRHPFKPYEKPAKYIEHDTMFGEGIKGDLQSQLCILQTKTEKNCKEAGKLCPRF